MRPCLVTDCSQKPLCTGLLKACKHAKLQQHRVAARAPRREVCPPPRFWQPAHAALGVGAGRHRCGSIQPQIAAAILYYIDASVLGLAASCLGDSGASPKHPPLVATQGALIAVDGSGAMAHDLALAAMNSYFGPPKSVAHASHAASHACSPDPPALVGCMGCR